ncbi:hypothetical protein Btru_022211 [Bulinus truncatus]|nr:hypothetical protein Btru_022211 [Bulinus truncatus]
MRSIVYHVYVSMTCAVNLSVILSSAVLATAITQDVFKVMKGYKIYQGTQLKAISSKWNSATFCSMLCSSGCGSAIYNPKNKTCITFVEKLDHYVIMITYDSDWQVLYRDGQKTQHGDWIMVFRAQKEINVSMFDAWRATGQHDDKQMSTSVLNGCYRLDNMGGCKQHFRSSILDNWTNIKEVKFSLYVNGSEVNYVVFNGTSTTRDSWFQQSNILNSSWSGIKSDRNIDHFDIFGFSDNLSTRRFVISGLYGSCSNDTTYFVAVDKRGDYCSHSWIINATNFPVLVYSKETVPPSARWCVPVGVVAQSTTPRTKRVSHLWKSSITLVLCGAQTRIVQHANWTMVFRAQKEINSSLFDVWTDTGRYDDSPLSSGFLNGCYRLDNLGGCKQHFRSSILDNWNNVRQVKLSLYINGSEVNYIIFDGTSTTRDSWFYQSSIQASSWPKVKTDHNIAKFNMTGVIELFHKRDTRFVLGVVDGAATPTGTQHRAEGGTVSYNTPKSSVVKALYFHLSTTYKNIVKFILYNFMYEFS